MTRRAALITIAMASIEKAQGNASCGQSFALRVLKSHRLQLRGERVSVDRYPTTDLPHCAGD